MKAFLKYQLGGDLSSYLIDVPLVNFGKLNDYSLLFTRAASSRSEESSNNKSDKNSITVDNIISLLKELHALPTETEAISDRVRLMFTSTLILNDGNINTSDIVAMYSQVFRDVKIAEANYKTYEKAVDQLSKSKALNDVAIGSYGRVYVKNIENGQISLITPELYSELAENGNYQILTNYDLLDKRMNDPQLAFRNEIFNSLFNGIGIEKVNELITSVANRIGTTELENLGYSKVRANLIIAGFEQLTDAQRLGMSVDGLYKKQLISSTLYSEAQMALDYLWNTLPDNAKNRLRIASALMGNENIDQGAYELIGQFITSGLKTTLKSPLSLEKDPNEKSSSSSSSSNGGNGGGGASYGEGDYGGNNDKSNPYFNMIKQFGGEDVTVHYKLGNVESYIEGTHYSALGDDSGHIVPETSLLDLLNRGLGHLVVNYRNVVFGDKLLLPEDFANIMYTNSGGTVAILPCKRTSNGPIVDLSVMDEFNEALKELLEIENPTDELVAQIYIKHNLMQLIDLSTGRPNKERFALFLITDGIGVNKDNFLGNNSRFLELVDDPSDELVNRINNALSTDKNNKYEVDTQGWIEFNGYDRIYKGRIYIPLTVNELKARTGYDKHVDGYATMEADYLRMMKSITALNPSSNDLGIIPKITTN